MTDAQDFVDSVDSGFYQSGRWTENEHELFLNGLKMYGRNWKRIQCLIKTRSSTQVRTHAQKFFSRDKYPATKRGRYASRLKDIDSPALVQWLRSEESVKRSKRQGKSSKEQYPPESPLNYKPLRIKGEGDDLDPMCIKRQRMEQHNELESPPQSPGNYSDDQVYDKKITSPFSSASTICDNIDECIDDFKALPPLSYSPRGEISIHDEITIKEEQPKSPLTPMDDVGCSIELLDCDDIKASNSVDLSSDLHTDDRDVEPLDLYVEPNSDNDYLQWLAGQDTSSVVNFFDLPTSQPGHW